jgi:hypothetical protein
MVNGHDNHEHAIGSHDFAVADDHFADIADAKAVNEQIAAGNFGIN